MKTEEANRLKDKNVSHSMNSINANVVEFSDQNRFKGKVKNSKKYSRRNKQVSTKMTKRFRKGKSLAMFVDK